MDMMIREVGHTKNHYINIPKSWIDIITTDYFYTEKQWYGLVSFPVYTGDFKTVRDLISAGF